jgi:hypothetical protein
MEQPKQRLIAKGNGIAENTPTTKTEEGFFKHLPLFWLL